jgi:hypothetical protein
MTIRPLLIAAALALPLGAACDQSAKATSADGVETHGSAEYETCSATVHCKSDLRCVDGVCRSSVASALGDYYAAVGQRELSRDNVEAAVAAYTRAVNQYKVEELPIPSDLFCAQGHALAMDRDNQENAELGARVLHRCVRDLPARSRWRTQALADLAILGDVGLDPMLLGAKDDADRYLTKAPKTPSIDKVDVQVKSTVSSSASTYTGFVQKLTSDEIRDALLPCWKVYNDSTKEKTVSVTLSFKYYFYQGYYADQDRHKLDIKGEPPAPTTPQAIAEACVHGVVAPVADAHSKSAGSGSWSGDITLVIGFPQK